MCNWQPIYLNLQLRTRASGNEPTAAGGSVSSDSFAVTANRDVGNDGLTATDSTVNPHAPVRDVVSVNGEEEDVNDINIHDFTTFEQEDLIGSKFFGRLKRKSNDSTRDEGLHCVPLPHNRLSFRGAVRAVLTTETIMQAMKHYNHRSDTETEDEEDDVTSSEPTAAESCQFDAKNTPAVASFAHGNDDLTSAEAVSASGDAKLSAPAVLVVDSPLPSSDLGSSKADDQSKVLLEDADVAAVTVVDNVGDHAKIVKPTDGVLTPTANSHQTDTADTTGCRCCCVQWMPSCMLIGEYVNYINL